MDALQEILLSLGRIQGAVDAIARQQEELSDRLDNLDRRLRAVELKAVFWGITSSSGVMAAVHYLIP